MHYLLCTHVHSDEGSDSLEPTSQRNLIVLREAFWLLAGLLPLVGVLDEGVHEDDVLFSVLNRDHLENCKVVVNLRINLTNITAVFSISYLVGDFNVKLNRLIFHYNFSILYCFLSTVDKVHRKLLLKRSETKRSKFLPSKNMKFSYHSCEDGFHYLHGLTYRHNIHCRNLFQCSQGSASQNSPKRNKIKLSK